MISNQILQNTIDGLKGISRVDFCVLDTEGKELAATFDNLQDRSDAVLSFVESPADSQVITTWSNELVDGAQVLMKEADAGKETSGEEETQAADGAQEGEDAAETPSAGN